MGSIKTNQEVKSIDLSIKVLRADGSLKKDYGVVAFWHRNPIKRGLWRIKQWLHSL